MDRVTAYAVNTSGMFLLLSSGPGRGKDETTGGEMLPGQTLPPAKLFPIIISTTTGNERRNPFISGLPQMLLYYLEATARQRMGFASLTSVLANSFATNGAN
ncbi:hypothetical protein QQF64_018760 [Cirrhinus molitorella]|uniref:Uncharacterized protein n=1 Tax=Cirrhinus molitorella TaxID=172907 RepID=A0ABR3LGZ9_9TELE